MRLPSRKKPPVAPSEGSVAAQTMLRAPSSTGRAPISFPPGKVAFRAMGLDRAYGGAPAAATAAEGDAQLDLLAAMVETEVVEALALRPPADGEVVPPT